jgi:hypothetical protein
VILLIKLTENEEFGGNGFEVIWVEFIGNAVENRLELLLLFLEMCFCGENCLC